jgi:hypothetical protein
LFTIIRGKAEKYCQKQLAENSPLTFLITKLVPLMMDGWIPDISLFDHLPRKDVITTIDPHHAPRGSSAAPALAKRCWPGIIMAGDEQMAGQCSRAEAAWKGTSSKMCPKRATRSTPQHEDGSQF